MKIACRFLYEAPFCSAPSTGGRKLSELSLWIFSSGLYSMLAVLVRGTKHGVTERDCLYVRALCCWYERIDAMDNCDSMPFVMP